MDKDTPPAPGFNAQPPPYSEVAAPHPTFMPRAVPFSVHPVPPHHHPYHRPHLHHGYYGPESLVQTHIVTQQPAAMVHVVASSPLFGPTPRTMVCTSCNQTVNSKIVQQASTRTHICALSLCLVGCWPCAPCVYCSDCCMNVNHFCPNCDAYQGTYIPSY